MPVSKDFRVKKGLVVGENIDATSGNLSAYTTPDGDQVVFGNDDC